MSLEDNLKDVETIFKNMEKVMPHEPIEGIRANAICTVTGQYVNGTECHSPYKCPYAFESDSGLYCELRQPDVRGEPI